MPTKKKTVAKSVEVASVDAEKTVEKVAKLKKADVITELSNLQSSVQEELAAVSGKIAGALTRYDEVNLAILSKEARLQELFGVEAELLSLDEVRALREAEEALAEAEATERADRIARDEAEYLYTLSRQRRGDLDRYQDTLAATRKADTASRDEAIAQLHADQEKLALREAALDALEAKVGAFPAELDSAVKKAEAIVGNALKRQYEHEKQLAEKDSQSKEKLAAQEIAGLKLQLENAKKIADDLNLSLATARGDLKEISAEAVRSASGRQALEAVREHTAAQNQPPAKGR